MCAILDDPYRHLETDRPSVLQWQAAQVARARATIRGIGDRSGLTADVGRHVSACRLEVPRRGGERWFSLTRRPDGSAERLLVAQAFAGETRTLASARQVAAAADTGIEWYEPSPDGRWVAVGIATRGDELAELRLVDGDTGEVVPPAIPNVDCGKVAWCPDSSGLYCFASGDPELLGTSEHLLHVEPSGKEIAIEVPISVDATPLMPQVSPDGRFVGIVWNPFAPRLVCLHDGRNGEWLPGPPVGDDLSFFGPFVGESYVALTTLAGPRGRVVVAALSHLDTPAEWQEIASSGPGVLWAISAAGELLVLFEYLDGASRVRLITTAGEEVGTLPLPGEGVVSRSALIPMHDPAECPAEVTPDELVFVFSSVERGCSLYRYDLRLHELEEVERRSPGPAGMSHARRSFPSTDRHQVHCELVSDDGPDSGPRPTVIVAYGGWNAVLHARGHPGMFASIVEAGGVVAFAHVRGDATCGSDQWEAGRRKAKQASFDDVIAVAEGLIADGTADPAHLGLCGYSNGGLLVGAAITQRPELFRAAVALVPLLDMGRFSQAPRAGFFTWEYGDPDVPEEAEWLRAYSPYHHVAAGIRYPATLLVCAENDLRVPQWHGRKMVAALQDSRSGEGRPSLLIVHDGLNHETASHRAPAWVIAQWMAFLMHEIGLSLPAAEGKPQQHTEQEADSVNA